MFQIPRDRWSTKVIMTLTFVFSLLLIVLSFLYNKDYSDFKNIQISVACSILASNIIMFFTAEYMQRTKRRVEIIDRWGIEAIYNTRADMNDSANRSLSICSDEIEIIAFGLKSFRETKTEEIKRLLNKGVSIKILTMNPESKFISDVDHRENKLEGSTADEIHRLNEWVYLLRNDSKRNNIEIRYYNCLPLDFYYKIDSRVYVGPYLEGISSQQTISYEFSGGQGCIYWSRYFKKIWSDLND